jgi:uncharacterized protein
MGLNENAGTTKPVRSKQGNHEGLAEKLGFQAPASAQPETVTGVFTLALLDKNALEAAPINPDWILEGASEANCQKISEIGDYWTAVDHWSCTAGKFQWHYGLDETILILEGEAFIKDDNGVEYHALPGRTLSFPDGSKATWTVPNYVRKIAFNQRSVPTYLHKFCRAVNKVHRKLFR